MIHQPPFFLFFFFNDTATTEIYTLSLHDALPIWKIILDSPEILEAGVCSARKAIALREFGEALESRTVTYDTVERIQEIDRKSTRLNSSHGYISYAVFCLKKKKKPDSQIVAVTFFL